MIHFWKKDIGQRSKIYDRVLDYFELIQIV